MGFTKKRFLPPKPIPVSKTKSFGGYSVSFEKVADWPIAVIFGTKPLPPSEMTKRLWAFVKKRELAGSSKDKEEKKK
ncbi:MAG TPA: hypothetical protein VJH34_02145 [archaeon]|nr:hypothetical protein [archaeon]